MVEEVGGAPPPYPRGMEYYNIFLGNVNILFFKNQK